MSIYLVVNLLVFLLITIMSGPSFGFFDHSKEESDTIIHNPKITLGMGYVMPSQFQEDRTRYGQVNALIFLFGDEQSHPELSVSLAGLGIGYSSHHGLGMMVSPVSFTYKKTIGISYNYNLQKSGQGFSLFYQF